MKTTEQLIEEGEIEEIKELTPSVWSVWCKADFALDHSPDEPITSIYSTADEAAAAWNDFQENATCPWTETLFPTSRRLPCLCSSALKARRTRASNPSS